MHEEDSPAERRAALAARLNAAAQMRTPRTILYRDERRRAAILHTVVPIAASAKVLRARDVTTNELKLFLLDHVEIVPSTPALAPPSAAPARRPSTLLTDALPEVLDELWRLGWHVVETADRLSVHLTHRDGKPMKVPAAFVVYRPNALRRPWSVVAPGLPRAHPFSSLQQALDLFMGQVRLHAPARRARQRRG